MCSSAQNITVRFYVNDRDGGSCFQPRYASSALQYISIFFFFQFSIQLSVGSLFNTFKVKQTRRNGTFFVSGFEWLSFPAYDEIKNILHMTVPFPGKSR